MIRMIALHWCCCAHTRTRTHAHIHSKIPSKSAFSTTQQPHTLPCAQDAWSQAGGNPSRQRHEHTPARLRLPRTVTGLQPCGSAPLCSGVLLSHATRHALLSHACRCACERAHALGCCGSAGIVELGGACAFERGRSKAWEMLVDWDALYVQGSLKAWCLTARTHTHTHTHPHTHL